MAHDLKAREYKLLLDVRAAGTTRDAVAQTVRTLILPALARRVGMAEGQPRWRRRAVRFFDVDGLRLDAAGFSLRRRRKDDGEGEITLKLRLSDRFVVAAADLKASARGDDKLEEDIAPLEVATAAGVVVADPPDMRSRHALSVTEPEPAPLDTAGDMLDLFANSAPVFESLGLSLARDTRLVAGPAVEEHVFDGPRLDLGGSVGELAVTLWRLEPPAAVAAVVELSFRAEFDGTMRGPAARAAFDLFRALQTDLPLDLSHPSKTKLALPAA